MLEKIGKSFFLHEQFHLGMGWGNKFIRNKGAIETYDTEH